jgi:hypothetical protein
MAPLHSVAEARGEPVASNSQAHCALLPSARSQERATVYLDQLKASSDGWKFCVERFSATPYPEVKFWCLQTLHEVRAPPAAPHCLCCCTAG